MSTQTGDSESDDDGLGASKHSGPRQRANAKYNPHGQHSRQACFSFIEQEEEDSSMNQPLSPPIKLPKRATFSYIAIVSAIPGAKLPLLGGMRETSSSRFLRKEDAESWAHTIATTNCNAGRNCTWEVIMSNKRAEIL